MRELAAREGISFAGARGSCVIDDYGSRAGEHPYREIACIVRGRRAESVLIATALRPEWPSVEPVLARSIRSPSAEATRRCDRRGGDPGWIAAPVRLAGVLLLPV